MKKILAIVFVIVLLVLLIAQQSPSNTSQHLPSLPIFQTKDVAFFEIKMNGETHVQGKRDGAQWLQFGSATPIHLQATAIEQLLYDLQTMQVKRLVSQQPTHQTRFTIAGDQVTLKNQQGKILLDVFVGKPATDLITTYIRLAKQNTILTVDKTLTWQVKRTANAWLKKDVIFEQR